MKDSTETFTCTSHFDARRGIEDKMWYTTYIIREAPSMLPSGRGPNLEQYSILSVRKIPS